MNLLKFIGTKCDLYLKPNHTSISNILIKDFSEQWILIEYLNNENKANLLLKVDSIEQIIFEKRIDMNEKCGCIRLVVNEKGIAVSNQICKLERGHEGNHVDDGIFPAIVWENINSTTRN